MGTKNNLEMENFMNELLRTELNQYFIKETSVEKIEKTESDVIINLAADYDSNLIKFYLGEVGKMPLLTQKEENETLEIIKNKESEDVYYNQFICKELRIICALSKKYINKGFSFFGLIQVASIALIKAVEKIDYCKNFESFSDYLIWWGRNAIEQCIANRIKAVKIPFSMLKILEPLENTLKQAKII